MTKSASSRRAAPHRKSAAATGARSAAKGSASGTDWDRLAGQTDAEIEAAVAADPDAAPIDDAFWSTARVVRHPQGRPVLVRLDVEVVQWLRRQKDSDARVNDILRDRMKAEARSATKRKVSR